MENISSMLQRIVSALMALFMTFLGNLGIARDHFDTYGAQQYGDSMAQVMDIYVPSGAEKNTSNAAILYLHDGMFRSGSRADMKTECRTFTNKGYITASMDYSFLGNQGVSMFTMLDEISLAIQKLAEFSSEKGLNIKSIALAGKGAGGCLAMMYAYTMADYAAIDIKFVAVKVAPADFTPSIWQANYSDESIATMISDLSTVTVKAADVTNNSANVRDAVELISPTAVVATGNKLPTLFGYADNDKIVPLGNQASLEAALTAAKVPHDSITFGNSDHSMSIDLLHAADYDNLMTKYCSTYFG